VSTDSHPNWSTCTKSPVQAPPTLGSSLPFRATLTTSLNTRGIYCKGASGPSCDRVHERPVVLSSVVQPPALHQRKRWVGQSPTACGRARPGPQEGDPAQGGCGRHASPSPRAQRSPTEHQRLFRGQIRYGISRVYYHCPTFLTSGKVVCF